MLDSDGHIVTNFHVIEGDRTIEVSFGDEKIIPAELVGGDSRSDIAVLKIDPKAVTLVPVELGRSDNLRVGQRAIAIGNPFGQFGQTLTTGVISALDRMLSVDDTTERLMELFKPKRPLTAAIQVGRYWIVQDG